MRQLQEPMHSPEPPQLLRAIHPRARLQSQENTSILLLTDAMIAGGMERQIVELLKGMKDDGVFSIHLGVLVEGGGRLSEAEQLAGSIVPIRRASDPNWGIIRKLPYFLRSFYHQAKKRNVRIIHTFGCFSDLIGVVIGKLCRIPVINGSIRSARPRLTGRDKLSRLCIEFSDRIVANSYAGLESFGFQGNHKANVIHNGVDLRRFDSHRDVVQGAREFQLCMVANFTRKKDQLSLVDIVPQLTDRLGHLAVVLVGKGPFIKVVRNRIEELGLTTTIRIVSDCDHPEPYIATSDICFLLTNTSMHGEGISNAILEYMAMEKPVIATDSGGNRELVKHGETGYLVHENDSQEILAHVEYLFHHPVERKKIGEKGRVRVEEKFSLSTMLEAYNELYNNVLSASVGHHDPCEARH
jgi:glycosyltransferase involved in cell wall biosynthesis